tara:strand:+ start:3980 stop:5464 length:1485 start_codon:yes stop_codon:yes gene_type:complete
VAISQSLSPLRPDQFGPDQAQHLLNRAGFGGTTAQVAELVEMGLREAVKHLVDYRQVDASSLPKPQADADIIAPLTPEQRQRQAAAIRAGNEAEIARFRALRQQRKADDRRQLEHLQQWWLQRMIESPRPLEEKLVLLWHSHFATNHRTVEDSFLMFKQNLLLRRHANGRFSDLAFGIIRDPAMIRFLDNHANKKQKPNENLARELMELFTLGEGNYTENDIKQGARALTGYSFYDNEFQFMDHEHDEKPKRILGISGTLNGEDFVRILLKQKACAAFVCYKLYKHFVADIPDQMPRESRSVILQMARSLRATDYRIAPVLKKLFMSRHFYDTAIVGSKIKSPLQLIAGTIRMLGTPVRDMSLLIDAAGTMGQTLFNPPSVAGWSGGNTWINTSTLFIRQNLATYLITGKLPYLDGWTRRQLDYDPTFLTEGVSNRSPEALIDHLIKILIAGPIPAQRRTQLLAFVNERDGQIKKDRMIGLLMLITAMPEYQLC